MKSSSSSMFSLLAVSLVVVAVFVAHAQGFGALGHRTVAQLAYDRLNAPTKAAVDRYLVGSSLASAAVYPDTFRSQGGAWSGNLHFVNFPRDAVHYLPAYCGEPADCVVSAIANYTRRLHLEGLRGPTCGFARGNEPCPLSFLTHFVGDIHQPMHCGYADDKGGNNVKVTFFGKSTNLHSLWDSVMLERFEPNEERLVQYLAEVIAADPAKVEEWLAADPIEWADESFHVVAHNAYHFQEPQGTARCNTGQGKKRTSVEITEEYYAHSMPIILERIAAAGVRLAHIINQALP